MANKFKIKIGEGIYTINTEEDEEYVKSLSEELNAQLKKLQENNPGISFEMAAAIAAMQYCDDAKKQRRECERLKNAQPTEPVTSTNPRLVNARREIERLSMEVRSLRRELNNK